MNVMKNYVNKNIECSVTSCANHCPNDNYCALEKICVGCQPGGGSNQQASTDCRSFVPNAG